MFKERVCLIISHVIPWPSSAGNEVRIAKLVAWLRSCGIKVILLLNVSRPPHIQGEHFEGKVDSYFFLNDSLSGRNDHGLIRKFNKIANKLTFILNNRNASCVLDCNNAKRRFHNLELIEKAKSLYKLYKPEIIIAEYIFTSPILDFMPKKCLKMIDTHDMFSRKEEMVLRYGIEDHLACTPQEEGQYLGKADVIMSIQNHETNLFQKLVPRGKVITVGVDFELDKMESSEENDPKLLLIVGSDNAINLHGINQFIVHSWKKIRTKTQNVVLRIVGKAGQKLKISDDRIQLAGVLDDLRSEYRKAYLVLNPVEGGTGLKIKSIEAIAHSKPLISTKNGVEGIIYDENIRPFVVAETWEKFTDEVVSIISNRQKRGELIDAANQYARKYFSRDFIYQELKEVIADYINDARIVERSV